MSSAHDEFVDRAAAIEHSDPETYITMCRYLDESTSRIDRLDHELYLHSNVQRRIDAANAMHVDRVVDAIRENDIDAALSLLRVIRENLMTEEPV
jgi:hypothetical protein